MKQILIAGAVSLIVALLATPLVIRYFSARGWGQEIRLDGPQSHLTKRGTPSMGGVAIVAAMWMGYIAAHLFDCNGKIGFTATGLLVLGLSTAMAVVGFVDDLIKIRRQRNLGLSKKAKFFGQLLVSLLFGYLTMKFKNGSGLTPGSLKLSYVRDLVMISFTWYLFLIFVWIVVSAWSNAVNFADGLDGLAAGCAAMVFGTYVLITFWQYRNSCGHGHISLACYQVRDPLDLSIVAVAAGAACLGFLWWNAAPAKIYMGDTGSLAIGGLIAGLSITSSTELLVVVIGALFVAEMISVVVQIISFRTTGRRVFRMAPFHHHFELSGWAETTVTIRFWLLTALSCAAGLALFYSEFQLKK